MIDPVTGSPPPPPPPPPPQPWAVPGSWWRWAEGQPRWQRKVLRALRHCPVPLAPSAQGGDRTARGEGVSPPYGPPWLHAGARARHRRGWHGRRVRGPLRRSRDDRLLGGVAGGVAGRLGLDPTVVRIGFVLAALASGFGVPGYVLGWLLIPAEGEDVPIAARALGDWRGIGLALSVVPVVVVMVILVSALGAGWIGPFVTSLGLGGAGLVLVWRNVGEQERALVSRVLPALHRLGLAGRGTWRGVLVRSVIGAAVAVAGVWLLLLGSNRAVGRPLGGAVLVVAGVVVAFGPWWLHLVRDLVDERRARAVAEERADVAARLHDSVLQTLALIQRRADQPQQVVKLARAQERELRAWLFDGHLGGGAPVGEDSLAGAIGRLEREVEERHECSVETVVVGDCLLDDDLRALLDAGREAAVNAAKWSGAPSVSVFVEVEAAEVAMYVRDRGVGFDPDAVAPDRRGVSESIVGRMARHGGSAEVRSAPGQGTEVVLRMPHRAQGAFQASRT